METVGFACMVCQDSILPLERAKYYPVCDECLEILREVVAEKRKQLETLRQMEVEEGD